MSQKPKLWTWKTDIIIMDKVARFPKFSHLGPLVLAGLLFLTGCLDQPLEDSSSSSSSGKKKTYKSLITFNLSAPYNFGNVEVGDSSDVTVTLKNSGNLDIANMTLGDPTTSDYEYKDGAYPGTGGTCGTTLSKSSTCTIVISFVPTTTGTRPDLIAGAYTDSTSTKNLFYGLQGTGTLPANPSVLGLSDDTVPTTSKTWTWSCTHTCEYRYVIDTNSTYTFTTEPYDSTTSDTQIGGDDTYYIHVQARDTTTLLESSVVSVSAILDNTNPTDPSNLALGGDASETESDTLSWDASSDTNFSHYLFAIGTTAGGNDILDYTDVGDVLSYQATGLSITYGIDYFTTIKGVDLAGNESMEVTSAAWQVPGPPSAISNLSVSGASPNSITLGWSAPNNNGSAITDYRIQYKLSADSTWLDFSDGTSSDTSVEVTGLTASTSYDFRVRAYNGSTGPYSNVATGETTVDDPFFDPDVYQAMNLGGANASAVVALEDNTSIELNGSPLATLNAGQTHSF
ncbi:MAG: fibronectin type III domain-containing protein, partial [Bdellovibrionales bacterium]|nr:fibronectin type III domain-containing protein [Bdellovibrionales bacterium]